MSAQSLLKHKLNFIKFSKNANPKPIRTQYEMQNSFASTNFFNTFFDMFQYG